MTVFRKKSHHEFTMKSQHVVFFGKIWLLSSWRWITRSPDLNRGDRITLGDGDGARNWVTTSSIWNGSTNAVTDEQVKNKSPAQSLGLPYLYYFVPYIVERILHDVGCRMMGRSMFTYRVLTWHIAGSHWGRRIVGASVTLKTVWRSGSKYRDVACIMRLD